MTDSTQRRGIAFTMLLGLVLLSRQQAFAFQVRPKSNRFEALIVRDQAEALETSTAPVDSLAEDNALRMGWGDFRATHGPGWAVHLDRRSGAPLLVEGTGITWTVGEHATIDSLALSLRAFVAGKRALLLADDKELVLDRDGSGELLPGVWQIVFDRVVAGVPVAGERYLFTIGHGKLTSFGAPRWSRIDVSPVPDLTAAQAQGLVATYMKLSAAEALGAFNAPKLELVPLVAAGTQGAYGGALGAGYASALVWRLMAKVDGDLGTWEALVDAHTGAIRSLEDVNDYAHARGGVYPLSPDQICPDGCEQPNYPMPYARIYIGNTTQFTSSNGAFNCSPGGSLAETILGGPYYRVMDGCGLVVEKTTCDADLNLRTSAGTDCAVPPGSSSGNTHAARSTYYHVNRVGEHARAWLPSILWLTSLVDVNVNLNNEQVCNAFWDVMGKTLNFLREGGGCRNSGEIAGVIRHEFAHGLDEFDGGGNDNPNEAYCDITSFLTTHVSCLGRGFHEEGVCDGYGNACLTCTGIRDLDWDQREDHVPSTPAGISCPGGGGPCGKERHCEGYIAGETLWDLATRDLPASGMDLASAWLLTDKLWFKSRLGSGGNAYNCSLPNSNGCTATSWFSKLRVIDDDDGNLANGTPHAAAIFAAFDRHRIACGAAGDSSNQSSTICPSIAASALSVSIGNEVASLTWTPVANASAYRILKNDTSCAAGSTPIATATGTSFTDTGLVNGLAQHYTVQPMGVNPACDGPVSNCVAATPQPFAGTVALNAGSYSCTGQIGVTVTDANIGAATTLVQLASSTEPAGETITVTQSAPGSAVYNGTIGLTASAPAPNTLLSVVDDDAITATYVEANDGGGGTNIPRLAHAVVDCVIPVITKVQATNITGSAARITWTTNEPASSTARYGTAPPPGSTSSAADPVVAHGVDLSGLTECTSYLYAVDSTDVVGNSATDDATGAYHAFQTGASQAVSYPSTDTPLPIPDLSPAGVTSTLVVTDVRTVQDVNVVVNVQHTFDEDLIFKLTTPAGKVIALVTTLGGRGDNFTDTHFDDEASAPIGGTAPFTGTFRPESPLAVADGSNAAGVWTFTALDRSAQDAGTLLNWELQLTYAVPVCGPHASLRSHSRIADSCATGGPGNANAAWDAGEHVQFKVRLGNDGSTPLTGVHATVSSPTAGVVVSDGLASFPDIPAGGSADSLAPHFTAYLPPSLACGGTVGFHVAASADQGSWTRDFAQFVGAATNGTGRVLNESFDSGIPAAWTVVDGGTGGGAASTWTAANPGVRTIGSPMLVPVAAVDSDAAGPGGTQDEVLLTPVLDLATVATATLEFDEFFRWFADGQDEIADVDVRSSLTGGAWVNVFRQQGAGSADPAHLVVNISAVAAGASDAQVRFRFWNGSNEEYWLIDNVTLDTSAPGSCAMPVCALPIPEGAKPVADGSFGAPMRASRANALGTSIDLTWDITTCASADQHVLYGDLASVASVTVAGAACDLGTTGAATWSGVPAGSLWFVVVGNDAVTTEGSWGTDGIGGQRGGTTASGLCGLTTRNNAGVCP